MRTSGFTSYVAAEGMVEGVGLVMVLGGMGEVDSGIRDLGTGGTFTGPHSSVSTVPDGGGMDHIIMDRILIMEATPILAMDTSIPSHSEPRFTIPIEPRSSSYA